MSTHGHSASGRELRSRGIRAIRDDVRINSRLWQAAVARSAPDGYTLLYSPNTGMVVAPLVLAARPVNPVAETAALVAEPETLRRSW